MRNGVHSFWPLALACLVIAALVAASALPLSASAQAQPPGRFALVLDGVEVASFAEATGIPTEFTPADAAPAALKKLPGKRTPPTVTLKRGTSSLALLRWASLPPGGDTVARQSASLVMYATDGQPVARYHLQNAWPAKLEVPNFDASKTELSIETIEIVAESIQVIQ